MVPSVLVTWFLPSSGVNHAAAICDDFAGAGSGFRLLAVAGSRDNG